VLIYLFILLQLIVVSFFDLKYRKISNYWTLFNLAQFAGLVIFFPELYFLTWDAFSFPIIFFIVSFALFALKIMGAGDSKYITTFYLCVPSLHHEDLFVIQAYLTAGIGIFLLSFNTVRNYQKIKTALLLKDVTIIKNIYGKKFPYAPLILLSWIVWGALNEFSF